MRRAVNLALERVEKCAGVFCGDDKEGYNILLGPGQGAEGSWLRSLKKSWRPEAAAPLK